MLLWVVRGCTRVLFSCCGAIVADYSFCGVDEPCLVFAIHFIHSLCLALFHLQMSSSKKIVQSYSRKRKRSHVKKQTAPAWSDFNTTYDFSLSNYDFEAIVKELGDQGNVIRSMDPTNPNKFSVRRTVHGTDTDQTVHLWNRTRHPIPYPHGKKSKRLSPL